jgi:hypothetical protein
MKSTSGNSVSVAAIWPLALTKKQLCFKEETQLALMDLGFT